jgi:hypothetical protein
MKTLNGMTTAAVIVAALLLELSPANAGSTISDQRYWPSMAAANATTKMMNARGSTSRSAVQPVAKCRYRYEGGPKQPLNC